MKTYEFAVEYGFRFEYVEVTAPTEKEARARLWDDVLTVEQRDGVSTIECVSEREPTPKEAWDALPPDEKIRTAFSLNQEAS